MRIWILASALTIQINPVHAGGLDPHCAERGLDYNAITMKCDPPSKKPSMGAKDLVKAWREAVTGNENTFSRMDHEGCSLRGGGHREPSIASVKAVNVTFDDGAIRKVIPSDLHCEKENAFSAVSGTTCTISYYENKKRSDDFVFETRTLKMNTSAMSHSDQVIWTGPTGEFTLRSLVAGAIAEATVGVPESMAGDNGPGCKLARIVRKNQPSYRSGTSPRADVQTGH